MDMFKAIAKRRSIRAYKPKKIERNKLQKILEAANDAPSAGNIQAYHIMVVRDPIAKRVLAKACGEQEYIAAAPVVLAFCADPQRSEKKYGERGCEFYCMQDATVACAYAQLAATAVGLATVWIGALFDLNAIRKVLRLGPGLQPVALLPVGYADENPGPKTRRPLREMVSELS